MDFKLAREIMVDSQVRPNDVTDPAIVSAFLHTPREEFVPEGRRSVAYSELEITTSEGRSLWTPRDTGKLIKLAGIMPGNKVLVIGAGAGYEAALISKLGAEVTALEEDAELTASMTERFASLGLTNITVVQDNLADGAASAAPYDVIYVCGMIETLPESWGAQLSDGGRIVAVVVESGALGRGRIFTKAGDTLSWRDGFDAAPPRFTEFDRKPSFTF